LESRGEVDLEWWSVKERKWWWFGRWWNLKRETRKREGRRNRWWRIGEIGDKGILCNFV